MTDTSNADNSPDAQDDALAPSSWTPPRGAPSPLSSLAGAASDTGVWNRADRKTPDQPTTVAPTRQQFPGIPDQPPPTLGPPPRDGPPEPPPIGLSLRHPMPFRPRPIQRYFPPLPNRPWHQWGEPRPFGPQPQPWEVPGIYSNVARFFTNQGSGFTAPTAGMLGAATQGHSKAYMEGQKYALGILEERMKINAQALDEKSYQEQKDYRDAFALGGGDVGTWSGDPKAKDATELHDRLMEVANKYNDKPMLAALESGNLQRAENILKERDANGTSLRESVTQQRKEDATRKEEDPWREGGTPAVPPASATETPAAPSADGTTPDAGEGSQPATPSSPPSAPAPEAPTGPGLDVTPDDQPQAQAQAQRGVQVAQAGASDAPQPGMQRLAQAQPQAQQPQFTPTPSQALEDAANDKDRISGKGFQTAPIDQIAHDLVNGTRIPTAKGLPGVPPKVFDYAVKRQSEIEADLARIQADPRLKGKAAMDAIRKVDPSFADTLDGYISGRMKMPTAQRSQGLVSKIIGLGSKVDPTFNAQTFQTRQGTMRAFTVGPQGQSLVSIATAYSHLNSYKADLEKLKALGGLQNLRMRTVGGTWLLGKAAGGTPEERALIGALNNEMETSANEYERGTTGGKPTVSGRDMAIGQMDWKSLDPDTAIGDVDNKISLLKARMDKLKMDFTAGTGRQPDAMFKLFDQFSKSGQAQEQTDPLGVAPAPSPELTPVLKQVDSYRPPAAPQASSPEDTRALDWARSHPDDPRSKQILEHLGQ
jgi:hypothetical protein